jgi:hypothetical protein
MTSYSKNGSGAAQAKKQEADDSQAEARGDTLRAAGKLLMALAGPNGPDSLSRSEELSAAIGKIGLRMNLFFRGTGISPVRCRAILALRRRPAARIGRP